MAVSFVSHYIAVKIYSEIAFYNTIAKWFILNIGRYDIMQPFRVLERAL